MRTLDRFIDIQTLTTVPDPVGEPIETWTSIDARRPASYKPINGTERFISDQFVARQQAEFIIRWSVNVSMLNPLDRLIYPAGDSPILDEDIWDIMDVQELGRQDGLRILAARRAENV
jgi:head-tail adaptor